ncbi:glycosyltransferase family 4 protein [Alteromonas sp. B31-7]|uniref:glycosyltransferase family 4 protein n=1 Tax=Alteromonas sp. B31-7 TaxID=2785913 RepID=UPI0018C910A8|nr:glycosyltransferase family 1 protein [Alteromonas sp. B31-7]QPL50564.1 glycosyltransferase family 4 protein [Alteromonas sp. B31-7]
MRLCLEISPLQEGSFTGIPEVTARIAEKMLTDDTIVSEFFYESSRIPKNIVKGILKSRTGINLRYLVENRFLEPIEPANSSGPTVGLFTNRKAYRDYFEHEVLIVHDLSPLTHPKYHSDDTKEYYHRNFLSEVESSDLLVCVSESTEKELIQYFKPEVNGRTIAIPLGVDQMTAIAHANSATRLQEKPFVMILGTLEPRKNVSVVLEYLSQNNQFFDDYDVVFTGRIGWLLEFDLELERLGLLKYKKSGNIKSTGFIDERSKFALLSQAALVIYPSIFEGFGLPVIEAMAVGTNVLTTASSSIPEVGADFVTYFDPYSLESFGEKLNESLSKFPEALLKEHAAYYSWEIFYEKLKAAIESLVND